MADDDPPELRGYVPHEDDRPLRRPGTLRMMRVVVVVGIVALLLPGLYTSYVVQSRSAAVTCAEVVAASAPGDEPVARFELAGPGGPSWYCYARDFGGHQVLVGSLGLFPG